MVQQEFSEAVEEVGMIISSGYEKIHLNKLPLFALQLVDSSGSTSGSWPRKAEVLQNLIMTTLAGGFLVTNYHDGVRKVSKSSLD